MWFFSFSMSPILHKKGDKYKAKAYQICCSAFFLLSQTKQNAEDIIKVMFLVPKYERKYRHSNSK